MIIDRKDRRTPTETRPIAIFFHNIFHMVENIRLTSYGNFRAKKQNMLRRGSNVQKLGRQRIYTEFVRKTSGKIEIEMEK
jgi:hypothetical protein